MLNVSTGPFCAELIYILSEIRTLISGLKYLEAPMHCCSGLFVQGVEVMHVNVKEVLFLI